MASNFALTMYNIAPEWLSEGNHTPFHSEHSDPFRFPFTFGPKSCPSKLGCHVGLHATEDVIGTFAGSEGDFLVLASDRFILLTPKHLNPMTLGMTLFPDHTTHDIVLCEKIRAYPIIPGSIIFGIDLNLATSLRSITMFFGMTEGPVMPHIRPCLLSSLCRMQKIWKEVHDSPTKSITVEKFDTAMVELSEKNRLPIPMKSACHKAIVTPPHPTATGVGGPMFDALVSVVQSLRTDEDGVPLPPIMSAKEALQSGLAARPPKKARA